MRIELCDGNFATNKIINLGSVHRKATFRVKDDGGGGLVRGMRIERAQVAGLLRRGVTLYVDTPTAPLGPFNSIRYVEGYTNDEHLDEPRR